MFIKICRQEEEELGGDEYYCIASHILNMDEQPYIKLHKQIGDKGIREMVLFSRNYYDEKSKDNQ